MWNSSLFRFHSFIHSEDREEDMIKECGYWLWRECVTENQLGWVWKSFFYLWILYFVQIGLFVKFFAIILDDPDKFNNETNDKILWTINLFDLQNFVSLIHSPSFHELWIHHNTISNNTLSGSP